MDEVYVALPARVDPTTHVRSTLICASIQAWRAAGKLDEYLASLGPADQKDVLELTAGIWLPVDRAVTHYRACERVKLSPEARVELGMDVARRIQKSLLNVIVRLTRGSGVTPWSVFAVAEKLREQSWRGGAFGVTKTGPKDAILTWAEQPCAASIHFQLGFQGVLRGLCELYCRRAYVHVDGATNDDTLVLRASWA